MNIRKVTCLKCRYEWVPLINPKTMEQNDPKLCPKCKQDWKTLRKRKLE